MAHYNVLAKHQLLFPISSFDSVGGFFALSGFLMYPSLCKAHSVKAYVLHRALRILPPYYFTVLVCAFGLGFISKLPWQEYFVSFGFWKYLAANLSFLNWLAPSLPGVFEGSQYCNSAVDGSLWTMKIEWCLYLSVPIMVWFITRFNIKKYYAIVTVIILSYAYRIFFAELYSSTGKEIYNILGRQFFGQLAYFYAGMLIFFIQDWFYVRRKLIIVCGIPIYFACGYIPYGYVILSPIALSALSIAFSMLKVRKILLLDKANLSYNVYLLHYPVIQLAVFWGINDLPVWMSFGFVVAATVLLSVVSYYFVERHFYKLKSRIK